MFSYILRRCIYAIFVLLGVATVAFFIARLTGDPVAIMLPPDATVEQMNHLRAQLGMDKPLVVQYGMFIWDLVHFNMGESIRYGEPTLSLITERLPATLELAGASLIIALIVAIPAGIISAIKRGTWFDRLVMSVVLIGQSMPVFWVGILLILLFSVTWRLLPTGGIGGWEHLIMPAFALGLHMMALITRLLRSSLIEALSSDYIRTARAKGLFPRKVIGKHALRNSLLPVVTIVGLQIGALLGGSVVTEVVFAWPGVGQMIIQAINNRDFALVQTAIILLAGIFVIINLIVDLLYVVIDPRIQYK
ncbi:ABC transporter permease [Neobacillus novalis]|uniref:ABC transporter permease n=1 Tax=Neobacillus novalis TaxID=220687 RepID=A0AA95SCB7_9BACI|nr:ABC transporter permease [Neobacillus novalis]WHY85978.1 ABC transporter permease [Neobacillus novalis]